jgi:hypothetical protein
MFSFPYNEDLPYSHILQSVVEKYPRVHQWMTTLLVDFIDWRKSFKFRQLPKPVLGYWKIRGLAAAIRYQLIYCGVDFDMQEYD